MREAISTCDLPELVSMEFPDSGAQPGKQDPHIKAVWRGEENGSASLYRDQGTWLLKDHGNGDVFNAYQFLVSVLGMVPREAAKRLIEQEFDGTETAYSLYENYSSTGMPNAMADRGFSEQDLATLGIRSDGGDAIIPIYNAEGAMVNLKRRLNGETKDKYRYELSGTTTGPWYSPNFAENDHVLVVEGELNAMIAWLALGNKVSVVGMPGTGSALPPDELANRVVYIYADADKPGRAAVQKWADEAHAAAALSCMALSPLNQDFCEIAGETHKADLQQIISRRFASAKKLYGVEDRIVAGTYTVQEMRERTERYLTNGILIPTGWPSIDRLTGGLPESGIVHIAALSSMGKSVALRDILYHNVEEQGKKVMLFSPDQSPLAVFRFIASRRCGIPHKFLRDGFYPQDLVERYGSEKEVLQTWADTFDDTILNYSDRFRISEEDEVSTVIKAMERGVDQGYEIFAGDYMQLFQDDTEGSGEKAAKAFKKATRRLKVPMVFALQLRKSAFYHGSNRNPIPQASDIEGTGAYYQVAEQVLLIYNRDAYYSKYVDADNPPKEPYGHERDRGHVRMIVAKNKEGTSEEGDYVRLRFNRSLLTLEDPAHG